VGYSGTKEGGDIATLVKLLRVVMRLAVILLAAAITRARSGESGSGERPPLLPRFALGFAALVLINSSGLVPTPMRSLGGAARPPAGASSSPWPPSA